MSTESQSVKFTEIYDTLPPETRRVFVEQHLITLLNTIPQDKADEVISAARNQKEKLRSMPILDVKDKRKEIKTLLDALNQDSKISFLKERSNREEILAELADSLTSWLPDIWSVIYEYNVNFLESHMCLLFVAEVVSLLIKDRPGGCQCAIKNLPINVILKNRHGKTIKVFDLKGIPSIDEVVLWIWRDLFLSLSVNGGSFFKGAMSDMLEEIENVMGWTALNRLLYGGKKDDSEDDDDDSNDLLAFHNDFDGVHCSCSFHAAHWSHEINEQRLHLQELVLRRLRTIFESKPSIQLFTTLQCITLSDNQDNLYSTLSKIATTTPDTLAAALEIYADEHMPQQICSLLDTHSHLLRPRDATVLQSAVAVLADSDSVFWHARGLQIIEKELIDCISAVRAALVSAFSRIERDTEKQTLSEIMNLPQGISRQEKVQQWADAITTTSLSIHPAAFAAMMMGFPLSQSLEEGDNPELNVYLDFAQNDSDSEDLREEFQPNIEDRFSGWYTLSLSIKGGSALLSKVYQKAIEVMPLLQVSDALNEILNRLGDRPSKTHVISALEALATFCQSQRKKIATRRTKTPKTPVSPPSSFGTSTTGFPFTFSGGPAAPASLPFQTQNNTPAPPWGDMEEVD